MYFHPSLWRVVERSRESMENNFHCTVGGRLFATLDRGPWWPLNLLFMSTSVFLYHDIYVSLSFILLSFLFILLCILLLLLRYVFRNPLRNWAFEFTSFNPLGKENGWRWITKTGLMLPGREILLCNEPLTVTGLIQSGGDSHAGCPRAVWCCQPSFFFLAKQSVFSQHAVFCKTDCILSTYSAKQIVISQHILVVTACISS